MEPALKLLRELVALPSVNPAFLPEGDTRAGEKGVADFLTALAAESGLEVEQQEVLPNRPNLIARLSPPGRLQHRIMVTAHMDTIGGSPMTPKMLNPTLKHGRLHGRGACDTKGSLAAMFTAVSRIAHNGCRPQHTEILFVGLIDEEDSQVGSHAIARQNLTVDLAIVGEPTCLKVVTAHKGNLWLKVETQGKAAHGATPQYGHNAIKDMAAIVNIVEGDYARSLCSRQHPILGHPTVNVGVIHGGLQPNVVPDTCSITLDRRTLPGETDAGVIRELKSFLRQHDLRATISNAKQVICPALETDHTQPIVAQFLKTTGQQKPTGVHYYSDAAVLASGGIPSVVFGPGNIAQAHTAEEWIAVASLEKAARLLERYLRSLP